MMNKMLRASLALALAVGLAAPALAQSNTKAQSDKKPGQTCEGLDKASKAFSDCVKAQAQTTKDLRQPNANANPNAAGGKPKKN